VTVTVSVDPAFENTVSADDTVFVIARTAEGQGPPLAGVRLRAGELPADVTLSDDNAMLEGHRLSGHEQVEVVARVVADFETVPMQLGNFWPGHVVCLICVKVKPFGNEESGAEFISFEDWPHGGVVRPGRVVESQHDQLIGNWFEALRSRDSDSFNLQRTKYCTKGSVDVTCDRVRKKTSSEWARCRSR
jgi:hypothetical protein